MTGAKVAGTRRSPTTPSRCWSACAGGCPDRDLVVVADGGYAKREFLRHSRRRMTRSRQGRRKPLDRWSGIRSPNRSDATAAKSASMK